MLIVRETFTAKPGMASKLAKMFREMSKEMPGPKSRVLTDFVGPYNTVIWEVEINELGDFEKMMKEYASKPDLEKKMAGYTEMYMTGKREIYRVVE
jgi:hypothetical protein